jgi:uncharacterized protein (TIGR00251 family)
VIAIQETADGVTFAVKVQPRARRNAIVGELGGVLKLALTAPPVNGKANQACIDFLAEVLGLSRSAITIVSGHSSRNKVVRVNGISADDIRNRLHRSE